MMLTPSYYRRLETSNTVNCDIEDIDTNTLITSIFSSIFINGLGNIYEITFSKFSTFKPAIWNARYGWEVLPVESMAYDAKLRAELNYYKKYKSINNIAPYEINTIEWHVMKEIHNKYLK